MPSSGITGPILQRKQGVELITGPGLLERILPVKPYRLGSWCEQLPNTQESLCLEAAGTERSAQSALRVEFLGPLKKLHKKWKDL
ncbi:hypothetical protein H920_12906 [Fukomys damarensis]|uniref:Uncharacterized protein n=1 Tax=Fukomys damarensis TaxID=885580 RepID=A0A091D6B7_FUKDA|nr:hypothetical protein H920_12906 [Fukomys damarensis]